jgi:hypothetical protein
MKKEYSVFYKANTEVAIEVFSPVREDYLPQTK